MVGLHLLHGTLAVVDAGIDIEDVELLLQQGDGGQHAVAVQAVRVQQVRAVVGRHHELHAVGEELIEQAVQDHRIGDVADVEFIEADQAIALGDAACEFVERIGAATQLFELAVHLAHELVEVQARLAHHRHAAVEGIHQERLAAPHPAHM